MARMETPLLLLLSLAVTLCGAAGQLSCAGRCGEHFTRGHQCSCDLNCLQYNECCQDFQAVCTSAQSCRGRCGEAYSRGQSCQCDPQCIAFNSCCRDYRLHCDVPTLRALTVPASAGTKKSRKNKKGSSNSESEELQANPPTAGSADPASPIVLTSPQQNGVMGSGPLLPGYTSSSGAPDPKARGSSLPSNRAPFLDSGAQAQFPGRGAPLYPSALGDAGSPFLGRGAPLSPSALGDLGALPMDSGAPLNPSALGDAGAKVNVHLVLSHGGVPPSGPSQGGSGGSAPRPSILQDIAKTLGLSQGAGAGGSGGSGGSAPRPSILQDIAKALGLSQGAGAGLPADAGLCSDSPINGLTSLSNGTILIFKGGLFWSVDPATRMAGPPKSITDTLGIPSPIDTVFTRCNCQGKTYIIKGDQYWLLDENMMMEPGYPKPLSSKFPGLTAGITAALPVPASRGRPETIYFFKNGDKMQRYTFPPSSAPSCNAKSKNLSLRNGSPRNAAADLATAIMNGEINIKVTLKGFPTPVTSALSMPSPQGSDGYAHLVFSGPLFFSIHISGDLPALRKPDPLAAFAPLPILGRSVVPTASTNMAAQSANPPPPANGNPLQPANSIFVWLQCPM